MASPSRSSESFLLLLLAVTMLFSAGPAFAAPCTVTTNADSGPGSLRERIADPACDPIDFQAGLVSPIVLTSG